jgi:HEAT repeat protein
LETLLLGLLVKGTSDEPVRRWAINALAFVGQAASSLPGVLNAINQFADEPQVVSAAVAAVFRLSRADAQKIIDQKDFLDPTLVALSALQSGSIKHIDVAGIAIDIERESILIQKLALVVVGLDKAPPNLFHPRFSNREIVKVLGRSGEPMVSQYAVWATAENDNLTADDLGISPSRIDDHPFNVQSYIFRLYASQAEVSDLRHEIICQGIEHQEPKVRLGTAIGLRDTYYDGLEAIVSEWIVTENDPVVREHVLDHIIRQSEKASVYFRFGQEEYEAAQQDDKARERMRAMGARLPISQKFQEIEFLQGEGLFRQARGDVYMNNNYTIGSMQGVNSVGGNSTNTGDATNNQIVKNFDEAKITLKDAVRNLDAIPLNAELKKELLVALEAANGTPTRGLIGRARELLVQAKDSLVGVADASDAVAKLAGYAALLSPFLL